MELIDVQLLGLPDDRETQAARSTANALCIVAEGRGTSTIGNVRIEWEPNDVFTIPHWQWATHRASTRGAKLMVVSDRDFMRRLNLLRDEVAD